MEHNKASSPHGFPSVFYQTFWKVIKDDLMLLCFPSCKHELPLFKLIFRVITLLPQKDNVVQIQKYRPICLHNASLYFSTKVATNHITKTASNVIIPTQSAFMPGRVLEGVVVLHETIHELHQKKMDGVLFKIDFEKAYDKAGHLCKKSCTLKAFI
jgi:hypothetical protein